MIRSQLIQAIAAHFPSQSEATIAEGVQHILECFSDAIRQGQRVEIRDFGSFVLRHYSPRPAVNPKTQKKVVSSEKYLPRFRAGLGLRERMNQAAKAGVPIQLDNKNLDLDDY